jgi:Lar family restriction alleviation protein
MSEELKPCPFCGSVMKLRLINGGVSDPRKFVECFKGCWIEGPRKQTDEEAIAAWNRRALFNGEVELTLMEGDKASCHICRPEPPRREAETCKEDEKGYCLTHTAYCRPPDPSASQQRREAEQAVLKAAKLWRMAPGWHTRNELERAVDAMTAALTPAKGKETP